MLSGILCAVSERMDATDIVAKPRLAMRFPLSSRVVVGAGQILASVFACDARVSGLTATYVTGAVGAIPRVRSVGFLVR
jgi:hypothetical protein